ncbi:MAG TPA: polyprenyl synthetase family protein, partial [Longimicrobiales bacterium]|nr:polyprenyl synthetase family protein [Longimicrobiales bacterium]
MSTRAPISPNGATATTQALPRGQAAELSRTARAGLRRAARWATDQDMAVSIGSGQLIRPLVAMAPLRDVQAPPRHFWDAVLAVQLAHEASLVHDDIVDGAVTRRGEPTVVSREGVPGALVHGDHLLTSAYRCAARTGSVAFTELFTRAVERTVAAERAQGRATGTVLDWDTYERIAMGKAGELLGCALAVAPVLEGRRDAAAHFELGRVLGIVYQMFDDLLDYCPRTDTGKPCLGDYGSRRWTWVMAEAPELGFGLPTPRVMRALHTTVDGTSPMGRALGRFTRAADGLRLSIRSRLPDDRTIEPLLTAWTHRARQAVIREAIAVNRQGSSNGEKHPRTTAATTATTATAATRATRNQPGSQDPDAALRALRSIVPEPWAVQSYLGQHSRSFRFSLRLFPPDDRARIARVYAYCRVTDNLVDSPTAGTGAAAMLDAWMDLSRRAYDGETTPFPVLDTVMTEMARAAVPFAHAEALADGMRMDL